MGWDDAGEGWMRLVPSVVLVISLSVSLSVSRVCLRGIVYARPRGCDGDVSMGIYKSRSVKLGGIILPKYDFTLL